jgi:5-(carboxyamino)imidazole ribonucleotide synthase
VLAIELFQTDDQRPTTNDQRLPDDASGVGERLSFVVLRSSLVVNELAPRVHNSGHWTIEGAATSQFENHLRAIAGLPLGATAARGHAAMLNLIGATPDAAALLALPEAHLHLYGKEPRPGRKLGHVTVRADDPETLERRLAQLERMLS